MTVSELIERLKQQPQDAEVDILVANDARDRYPARGVGAWTPENGDVQRIEVVGWKK